MDTLLENFNDLRLEGSHGCIRFIVGGREFQGHRSVLAARSPIFARMLEHEMAEKGSDVVEIADCDGDSFQDFLTFIYSGDVRHVTSSNAVSLYKLAEMYDLKDLKDMCISCLTDTLSMDLICDVIALAAVHCERELSGTRMNLFIHNVSQMLGSTEWIAFAKEHPGLVHQLFEKSVNRFVQSSEKEQLIKCIFGTLIREL